jgi:hypothetical protein
MFQKLKKSLSFTVAMLLVVQHLTFLTFAAGDFTIVSTSIQLRGSNNPTYAANPGTTFSIAIPTSNNLPDAVQSAYLNIDFGNNAGFSYQ